MIECDGDELKCEMDDQSANIRNQNHSLMASLTLTMSLSLTLSQSLNQKAFDLGPVSERVAINCKFYTICH